MDEIVSALKPVKEALLGITRDNSTLLPAKYSFEYMFDCFTKTSTGLSQELLVALRIEYEKRCSSDLVDFLEYFEISNFLSNMKTEDRNIKRDMLLNYSNKIYHKLFSRTEEPEVISAPPTGKLETSSLPSGTLSEYESYMQARMLEKPILSKMMCLMLITNLNVLKLLKQ
ncbi:hypothetical protein NGRA_2289 [Nosema granulosis]|uniref:Uncharacterized protein n=1 Tax=Nosema granulosis TaxID=83296 RepID=A0A9P6KYL0_9MICR|nr:hypothetical protein NGRA_2289 [Nosema granulosis]